MISPTTTATPPTIGSPPKCSHCEKRDATCIGVYEDSRQHPTPACDVCCGHGNEDGWCEAL